MKVTVYGATWCAFCKTEKQWLDSKGVEYTAYEVDEDQDAAEKLEMITGMSSVPVTVIEKDDQPMVTVLGFDRVRLASELGV